MDAELLSGARWRRSLGRTLARLAWLALGAAGAAAGLWLHLGRSLPDPRAWHRLELTEEYRRGVSEVIDLSGYLGLEERLFAELATELERIGDREPLNRFNLESPTRSTRFDPDWNRTIVHTPEASRGGVLLLHGLSDSPYSTRSIADLFARHGWTTISLRLPGHGTVPSALRTATWEDWRETVRLAVRAFSRRSAENEPLVLVGYSNGAALALDYTLEAIAEPGWRVPDRLVLLSPALAVAPIAALARFQILVSRLPGLEKLGWTSILPEYDPYKYNSFALGAARQIHDLTTSLEARLTQLAARDGSSPLPPILTLQSAVDATVPPLPSLGRLYGRPTAAGSELVLYDVNRRADLEMFLTPAAAGLLQEIETSPVTPFRVTVLTNVSKHSSQLEARRREAGQASWSHESLPYEWPPAVFSLSHVAIPFPPDDPVYGRASGLGEPFPFGALESQGERGVLLVPASLLQRLRYNPFFADLERRVTSFAIEPWAAPPERGDAAQPLSTRAEGEPTDAER